LTGKTGSRWRAAANLAVVLARLVAAVICPAGPGLLGWPSDVMAAAPGLVFMPHGRATQWHMIFKLTNR
jgi:hypothetical protein